MSKHHTSEIKRNILWVRVPFLCILQHSFECNELLTRPMMAGNGQISVKNIDKINTYSAHQSSQIVSRSSNFVCVEAYHAAKKIKTTKMFTIHFNVINKTLETEKHTCNIFSIHSTSTSNGQCWNSDTLALSYLNYLLRYLFDAYVRSIMGALRNKTYTINKLW